MRTGTGHKNSKAGTIISIRAVGLCLLVLLFLPGYGRSQVELNSVFSESIVMPEDSVTFSVWEDSMVGPPVPEPDTEIPQLAIFPPELEIPPRAAVFSDEAQQIPVMEVRGEYFDPSGFCSTGPLSEESNQSVRSQMLRTYGSRARMVFPG
ncbi:MAG: hypothetical protein NTY09_10220 [bacterium]|nr:hypothetical protein [bacterium]